MKTIWRTGKRVLFGLMLVLSLNLAFFPPSLSAKAAPTGPVPFQGSYYNNRTLSGTPALTREDQTIKFLWGTDSPGPGIRADHFLVRWARTAFFQTGTYQFTVTADDGVRLLIDGRMVIDQWHDQSATSYTTIVSLSDSAAHRVVMEYYENRGSATAVLAFQQVNTAGSFVGAYYNNRSLSGVPTQMRVVPSINFAWEDGSPATLPTDNFSARWTRTTYLNTGQYQFTITADDGVRLYLDGKLIIDKWKDQSATIYHSIKMITAGTHTIKMEYYEHWGTATARLNWQTVSAKNGYVGVYYDNMTLSGTPTQMRIEPAVRFNWGEGSPDPTIPADEFSARWIRTVNLSEGTYRFTVVADDGVRLFVDGGSPLIDSWRDQAATRYARTITLSGGVHEIIMEYYENGGIATARLNFQLISS